MGEGARVAALGQRCNDWAVNLIAFRGIDHGFAVVNPCGRNRRADTSPAVDEQYMRCRDEAVGMNGDGSEIPLIRIEALPLPINVVRRYRLQPRPKTRCRADRRTRSREQ